MSATRLHTLTLCAAADIVFADLGECFLVLFGTVGTTAAVICDSYETFHCLVEILLSLMFLVCERTFFSVS